MADDHPQAAAGQAGVQDLHQAALLLESPEERAHAVQVLEFRLLEHVGGAVEVDAHVLAGGRERPLAHGQDPLQQGVVEGLLFPHHLQQPGADRGEGEAGEVGVQVVGARLQVLLRQLLLHLDHLVGDEPGPGHHHHQDAGVREAHEVDVTEARAPHLGGEDEADLVGESRQEVRCVLHHFVGRDARGMELVRDGGRLAAGKGLVTHQGVHVYPVSLVGRHPAGAGVGMVEVAHALEVRHDVPDRGRGQGPVESAGEAVGADGGPRGDVKLDEGLQDVPAALIQNGAGHVLLQSESASPSPELYPDRSEGQAFRADPTAARPGVPAPLRPGRR